MTGSSRLLSQKIIQQARKIGFDAAGIAPADPLLTDRTALDRWLSEGRQGDMAYLARDPARRSEPGRVLPGARSMIVLAMNYYTDSPPSSASVGSGKISRYAWGRDYHGVIEPKLEALEAFIIKNSEAAGEKTLCRSYVDYGPVLEKAFARRAGLGFIGKNTLLITEGFGSWVFLAVILTTIELEAGSPAASQCGSCTACLEACPTGALTAPFHLDARRCISYLTIENKGEIPPEDREKMSGWAFGCDICQEVCPYNEKPAVSAMSEFKAENGAGPLLDLEAVMGIKSDEAFREKYKDSPLLRPKRRGLQRNARALLEP